MPGFDPSRMHEHRLTFEADSPEHTRIIADGILANWDWLAREIERSARDYHERHGVDRLSILTPREWSRRPSQSWVDEPVRRARPLPPPRPSFDRYGLRVPDNNALWTEWANYIPPRVLPECAKSTPDPMPKPGGVMDAVQKAADWSRDYQRRGSPPPPPPYTGRYRHPDVGGYRYTGAPLDEVTEDLRRDRDRERMFHSQRVQQHQFTRSAPRMGPPPTGCGDSGYVRDWSL